MREEQTDSMFQDYVNDLRARRGECPQEEPLVAFQEGALTGDPAAEIEAHLAICGLCQMRLRWIEQCERLEGADIEEPGNWTEIERRGRARFHAFLESQAKKEQKREAKAGILQRMKALLLRPAFAYLLVLALLYPAYQWVFEKPEALVVKEPVKETEIVEVEKPVPSPSRIAEVEKPAPSLGRATLPPSFELRSTERGAGEGRAVVRLSPGDKSFVLTFLAPISELPEFVYNLEVRDSRGQVVTSKKEARAKDWLGNFSLEYNRKLFPPGEYELRVKEVNKKTQAVRREFTFSFTVQNRD